MNDKLNSAIRELLDNNSTEDVLAAINNYREEKKAAAAKKNEALNEARKELIYSMLDYLAELLPDFDLTDVSENYNTVKKYLIEEVEPQVTGLNDFIKKVETKAKIKAGDPDEQAIRSFIDDILRVF